ncbi:CaiB/BaiF CoA-transferase family protein [Roseobacter sp. HKCCA0434]|uniref:CaiB/BaiF CoA transferase family protein n=1 Tax=Roseobacter sp. HKCCA0434 TaxID=3079297 RepID=UPI002905D9A5|nr:CaiB/BaiF CoA-transferase family protein [Roseobacter sp. HKCCA0434]
MGPLAGVRVVEFQGLGPAPFAAMWLADMGAEVVELVRPGARALFPVPQDELARGRRRVEIDLKDDAARAELMPLIERADILIEGFRPGVMERLGLGPEVLCARNPRLVYGRMTGWGQDGPRAAEAGHDITYLALTGALHAIGGADRPVPPLNLLGGFAGGSLYLIAGLLAALVERGRSGQGQVVDAAIVDGTAHLTSMIHSLMAGGHWRDARAANLLDGGAPYYRCYVCADGLWLAIGALEPQFWAALVEGLGGPDLPDRADPANWPLLEARLAGLFAERSRADWLEIFDGTDACVAPVHDFSAAAADPHMQARAVFTARGGGIAVNPAPRLSRTPGALPEAGVADTLEACFADWR